MLTKLEQELIRRFMKDFPLEDLIAIADSVSKRNLLPTSSDDAIDIICQHSESIERILEKRKITKRYLSEYLHKNKVSIIHSWDKPALIRKLLDFWNISRTSPYDMKYESLRATPPNQNQNFQDVGNLQESSEYFKQLSYNFAKWFYSLINDEDCTKLGPEHFFVDSEIKLTLNDENSTDIVEANNSVDVAGTFRDVKLKYNLKFLPNLTPNAIRYECDIHGQVMVMVSGTLHSNTSQVVGVFEQFFLLIRDMSDNDNWKIKKSQIILRSMNSSVSCSDGNVLPVCP